MVVGVPTKIQIRYLQDISPNRYHLSQLAQCEDNDSQGRCQGQKHNDDVEDSDHR
jgi:hypothetical protein